VEALGFHAPVCRIPDMDFGEYPFHAVSILEGGCGRRLGAA